MTQRVSRERRDSSFRFAPFGMTDEQGFWLVTGRLRRPVTNPPSRRSCHSEQSEESLKS